MKGCDKIDLFEVTNLMILCLEQSPVANMALV